MSTISIVIPVYNGERFLGQAISSALNQTRPADEIVVYDDSSRDTSVELARSFGDRVRVVCGQDGPSGFVNGWNKAISQATGDYIAILHQDDLLYADFIRKISEAIDRYPDVRHFFALCDYIDGRSEVMDAFPPMEKRLVRYTGREYVRAYQQTYGPIPHIHRCPGVVTHRSVFVEDGCRYREAAGHIADDDFFYRVGQYTDVVGVLEPLAAYRQHSGSATSALDHLKMVRRLALDYLYQVRQWHGSEFLDLEQHRYFEHWALKYLFSLLLESLRYRDRELFNEAKSGFGSMMQAGLHNEHRRRLLRIRALLVSEKLFGFRLLSSLLSMSGRYA